VTGHPRTLVAAVLVTLSTLAVLATPQQPTPPQSPGPQSQEAAPVFRTGVELISLSVTVTEKGGKIVTDLAKEDFIVFEDKKQQEIANFTSVKDKTQVPIGLGLVLDASQSMTTDRLGAMRTAVEILLRKLRKEDEVYFVEFSATSTLTLPWTTDKNAVLNAVRRIKTKTGTAIFDAIADSLPISATGKAKKQVMLVITDGADYNSKTNRARLAELAQASDVLLYVFIVDEEEGIGQGRGGDSNLRQAAGELSQITTATGGKSLYLQGFQQLEDAIDNLSREVTQQYFLEYQRGDKDGKYHDIVVGVRRKDVVVRHRRGYVAD
jgi:Ca-activated chloride channel homolog